MPGKRQSTRIRRCLRRPLGEAGTTSAAELDDASVEEVLTGQSVAQRAVHCDSQPLSRLGRGEVDDRSSPGDHRDTINLRGVESDNVATAMDHVADAVHGATASDDEVKGRLQPEPVEAIQGSGCRTKGPAWSTDRGDQLSKLQKVTGVDEGAVCPTADAAQVSASKRGVMRIAPLTICGRQLATGAGHGPGFNLEKQLATTIRRTGHAQNRT